MTTDGAEHAGVQARTPLLINWESEAREQLRRGAPYEQVVAEMQARRGDAERGAQSARAAYAAERYSAGASYDQVVADLVALGVPQRMASASGHFGYAVYAADELRRGRTVAQIPAAGPKSSTARGGLLRYAYEELGAGVPYEDVVAAVARMGVPKRAGTSRAIVNEEAWRVALEAGDDAAVLRRDVERWASASRAEQAREAPRVEGVASIIEGTILTVGGLLGSLFLSAIAAGEIIAIGALIVGPIFLVRGIARMGIPALLAHRMATLLVLVSVLALAAGIAIAFG